MGVELQKTVIGKPYYLTYEFAEKRLRAHREDLFGREIPPLRKVYMVGDNPGKPFSLSQAHVIIVGADCFLQNRILGEAIVTRVPLVASGLPFW